MKKMKILLSDNSSLIRVLLAKVLGKVGFKIVAVAKNSEEALEKYVQCSPDIALLDLDLDGTDVIDVVRAIKKNNPEAVITLMMPEHMDDPDAIIDAVRAGARSFIKKPKMDAETKRRLDYILRKREVKNDAGRDQHADNRGNG
jgi:two-component system, chemotaxis family, chemotaxis protein CheY